MKIFKLILSLIMLNSVSTSHATNYISAEELSLDCRAWLQYREQKPKNVLPDRALEMGVCIGFIVSFFDANSFFIKTKNLDETGEIRIKKQKSQLFCVPEHYDNFWQANYIVRYLSELGIQDKDKMKLPATFVILKKYMQDFPCPKD